MKPKQTCSTVMAHGVTVVGVVECGTILLIGLMGDSDAVLVDGSLVHEVERHCDDEEEDKEEETEK